MWAESRIFVKLILAGGGDGWAGCVGSIVREMQKNRIEAGPRGISYKQ